MSVGPILTYLATPSRCYPETTYYLGTCEYTNSREFVHKIKKIVEAHGWDESCIHVVHSYLNNLNDPYKAFSHPDGV